MQGNFSTLLGSTVSPSTGAAADVFSVFAAGALSGAGATYIAKELRGHITKHFAASTSNTDPFFGVPLTR